MELEFKLKAHTLSPPSGCLPGACPGPEKLKSSQSSWRRGHPGRHSLLRRGKEGRLGISRGPQRLALTQVRRAEWRNSRCLSGPWVEWGRAGDGPIAERWKSTTFSTPGFFGGSDSKESACNAGDPHLITGLGRFPGEGNGYPLQYSCHGQRSLTGCIVHGVTRVGHDCVGYIKSLHFSIGKCMWEMGFRSLQAVVKTSICWLYCASLCNLIIIL